MPPDQLDLALLKQWLGRSETKTDQIHATAANALAATLDQQPVFQEGSALPPLWHWIYFWSVSAQSALGVDGHPERGGFLPPVPLPRRMWAGGRFRFVAPLMIGASASRISTITRIDTKTGTSGQLAFVTVSHQISANGQVSVMEEHDIVYRELPAPGATAAASPKPAPKPASVSSLWSRAITPDPVLLFRYTALTFNGHRIHYDRNYVTSVEGYPGLIVHGPLIATLLIGIVREHLPEEQISEFEFRAVGPLFDTEPFSIHGQPDADGRTIQLWAANARGELAMQAKATLSPKN